MMRKTWFCFALVFLLFSAFGAQAFAICGDGVLEAATEQCDDGRRDDGDGCSSTCQIEHPDGCADGQREGFVDVANNPYVAGCNGGWSVPGARSIEACGRAAGDDSTNPAGLGCSAVDLCAVGWHVCGSTQDVANNLGATTCENAAAPNTSAYFATQISGPGNANCSSDPADTNDNFGCGNVGGAAAAATCSPVTRFSNNLCGALPVTDGWTCSGASGVTEQTRIRKTLPQNGGVMCCFGPTYQVSVTQPGTFTNDPRPTISGTTTAPDGTVISVTLPDQSIVTTTVTGGAWSVAWPGTSLALIDSIPGTVEATAYDPLTGFAGTRATTTYVDCGNGIRSLGEQCDDNNRVDGDGCSSTCQLEICGNGLVQAGEACDDGNNDNSDGCSSMCAVEPGYTCPVQGGQCLTVAISAPTDGAALSAEPTPYQGSATPGATVTIRWEDAQGNTLFTAIVLADGSGAWSAVPQGLADGVYRLNASVTTTGGSVSDEVGFTLDTTPPLVTLVAPGQGSTTRDNTPTISGTAEPGAALEIVITDLQGNIIQTIPATSSAQGTYATDAAALPDGDYNVSVRATDAVGNAATAGPNAFTVDTTAPAITIASPNNGQLFNDRDVPVSGTAEPGAAISVALTDANGVLVTTLMTTADANGDWTLTFTGVANGTFDVKATATDDVGNSADATTSFIVDSAEPNITITAPVAGVVTTDNTPTLSGTADPDATVTLVLQDANGQTVESPAVTVDASGAWSVDAAQLPDGVYTLVATATRPNGKSTTAMSTFTVDTTAPALTLSAPADGSTTNMNMLSATGTSDAGQEITVVVKDAQGQAVFSGNVTADANGDWSLPLMMLNDGTYTVEATTSDAAGNTATAGPNSFTIDTAAPAVTITAPAAGSTTQESSPTITGTAEPGATVEVLVDGQKVGEATADANGDWSLPLATALEPGEHTVDASSVDAAGNLGQATQVTFTVAQAPTAPLVITAPSSGAEVEGPNVTVSGTAQPGDVVTVKLGDETKDVTVGEDGMWSVTFTDVPAGSTTVTAERGGDSSSVTFDVGMPVDDVDAGGLLVAGGACSQSPAAPMPLAWLVMALGLIAGLVIRPRRR